jgi:hypothetical protein
MKELAWSIILSDQRILQPDLKVEELKGPALPWKHGFDLLLIESC